MLSDNMLLKNMKNGTILCGTFRAFHAV